MADYKAERAARVNYGGIKSDVIGLIVDYRADLVSTEYKNSSPERMERDRQRFVDSLSSKIRALAASDPSNEKYTDQMKKLDTKAHNLIAATYAKQGALLSKQGDFKGAIASYRNSRDEFRYGGKPEKADSVIQLLENAHVARVADKAAAKQAAGTSK